jgi:hypothetical protein
VQLDGKNWASFSRKYFYVCEISGSHGSVLPTSVVSELLYKAGQLQSTDHELIPSRKASLAAMQGSAIRYYPT